MKHFLFSLFLLLCSSLAWGQSRLQFNQVRLVTTEQTVPANKVWKVVGIYTSQTSFGNHSATNTPAILVNGVRNFYVEPLPIGSGLFAYTASGFPFWLPAGATLAVSNTTAFINVIEFNVIPL